MLVVDEEIIYKERLHPGDTHKLIKKLRRHIFPAIAMDEEVVYVKDLFGKVKRTLKNHIKVIEGGANKDMFFSNIMKLKAQDASYYGMMFFNRYFKASDEFEHLSFKKWGGSKGFEVANKGTSKLSGILAMAQHFGIDQDHIYVFGDNYNDIEMLSGIENSIAMGNAVDEAKEVAAYTTDHVGEDGIEKACYHLGLLD